MTTVTKEMIDAAHDVMLAKGDFVLSATLLKRIYLAMEQAAPQGVAYSDLPDVDALAQEIRRVDGNRKMGAGALAEALMPFLRASRGQAPAGASYEKALEDALRERDDADDFIDTLLDEVLGTERAEWSSAYGRVEALEEVRERITAIHKPAVDRAGE